VSETPQIGLVVPPEVVQLIADKVAECLLDQLQPEDPWLDVDEAAAYLRCKRKRIYDLTSTDRLRVAKDGSRSLFKRAWLDEALDR
jgi:excisionase family DNA binding protein